MRRVMLALASIAAMFATSTFAQTPVALVEEVRGKPAGVEFMDYVSTGQRDPAQGAGFDRARLL